MNGSAFISLLSILLLFSLCASVMAGVSGNSETRFRIDNSRYGETQSSIEQWTSLYYREIGGDLVLATQFAVAAAQEKTSEQLYQCFIRSAQGGDQPELTIGRFEMSNVSGFTALDGFSVRQRIAPFTWNIYSGKPRHVDDYEHETADLLLAFATQYDLTSFGGLEQFNRLMFNLALDRIWSRAGEMTLHAGLNGERIGSDSEMQLSDFQLAVDLSLDDQVLQRVLIDTHFDLKHQGHVRVGYRYQQPDQDRDTFRDRFHGIYNMQRQSVLRGVWYLPHSGPLESRFEISGNRQEQGNGGLGMAIELLYPTQYGSTIEGRGDYLEIDDDRAVSAYLRYRQPLSSLSILQAEGVYQTKKTRLSGKNRLAGLSLSLSSKMMKQLFLNLNGEWLDHSDREDEYRLGLTLRYDFYQTNKGELP